MSTTPVIIVCDNVPFVKRLDCIKDMMENAEIGCPYKRKNNFNFLCKKYQEV